MKNVNRKKINGWNSRYALGGILAAVVSLTSCDSGFDVLNTDATRLTAVEPVFQLNNSIVGSGHAFYEIDCEAGVVQISGRKFTGIGACAGINLDERATMSGTWIRRYASVRELTDAMRQTAGDAEKVNLFNMIRIFRTYDLMRVTDTYGDAPYTEAGLALLEGIVLPQYDDQEFIYTSSSGILEELKNASAALDANAPTSDDALYGGDVTRWRRFGYSLLLRAAMRLSKVNPTLAEQYVGTAVSGGLMQSNADNAVIRHNASFPMPAAVRLNGINLGTGYVFDTFVDALQARGDPRLSSMLVRYPTALSLAGLEIESDATRVGADQIGWPLGFDANNVGPELAADGVTTFYQYSQYDRGRMYDLQAPTFHVTHAQTLLLLAEAAYRGWAAGDAATLYESAVESSMNRISTSYSRTFIEQNDIDAYIVANPLVAGQELEMINHEYWVDSSMIGKEAWSNFRRTGFPDLPPNPRQDDLGPSESFMRRFGYPFDELGLNPNVTDGVVPDRLDTRIWWDVK